MKRYIIFFFATIVLLVFGLSSCSTPENETVSEKETTNPAIKLSDLQLKNAGITLGKAQKMPISSNILANGILDVPPQNLVSIAARTPGFVKSTSLLEGTHIHKGDVLCVMENADFLVLQQEYISNFSRLAFLEKENQRQKDLAVEKVASAKTAEQTDADLKSLKATQKGLRKRLEALGFSVSKIEKGELTSELSITSPIDGYVTKIGINTGQFVQSSNLICEIVNLDHIHAELLVFENDLPNVSEGQKVTFSLTGKPEVRYKAEVYLINKKINPDRTVRVHAHLEHTYPEMIPNMQLHAEIATETKNVWTLPSTAIVTKGKSSVIYRFDKASKSFLPLEITTGGKDGENVEVIFPESFQDVETAEFVLTGAYDIKSFSENVGEED